MATLNTRGKKNKHEGVDDIELFEEDKDINNEEINEKKINLKESIIIFNPDDYLNKDKIYILGIYKGKEILWKIIEINKDKNELAFISIDTFNAKDICLENNIKNIENLLLNLNNNFINLIFNKNQIENLKKINENFENKFYLDIPRYQNINSYKEDINLFDNILLYNNETKIFCTSNNVNIVQIDSNINIKILLHLKYKLPYDFWDKILSHEWMKFISDDLYITNINLPGTHDSGANFIKNESKLPLIHISGFDYAKTQNLTIEEQLNAGVRLIDCRLVSYSPECNFESKNKLILGHGNSVEPGGITFDCLFKCFADVKNNNLLYFDEVMDKIHNFLLKYSSETVLVCIKKEKGDLNILKKNIKQIISKRSDYFYIETNLFSNLTKIPKLKECRGKIVLLNMINDLMEFGIPISFPNDTCKSNITVLDSLFSYEGHCSVSANIKYNYINYILKKKIKQKDKKNKNGKYINLSSNDGDFVFNFPKNIGMIGDTPKNISNKVNLLLSTLKFNYNYSWVILDFANEIHCRNIFRTNLPNNCEIIY